MSGVFLTEADHRIFMRMSVAMQGRYHAADRRDAAKMRAWAQGGRSLRTLAELDRIRNQKLPD